jgi:hypothetical protein
MNVRRLQVTFFEAALATYSYVTVALIGSSELRCEVRVQDRCGEAMDFADTLIGKPYAMHTRHTEFRQRVVQAFQRL